MNKKLSPWMLIILGIILLPLGGSIHGGVIGASVGVGVGAGALVCLILGIVSGIKGLFTKNKPASKSINLRDVEGSTKYSKSHSTAHSLGDEAEKYADILTQLSATGATDLGSKHRISDSTSTELMVQLIGFSIINLMRQLKSSHISPERGREAINLILKRIGKNIAPTSSVEHEAYISLGRAINQLSNDYSDLPLKHAHKDTQGGTLLWEYGKLVSKTIDPSFDSDLMALMNNISVITSVNNSVKIDGLIDSLK